MIIALFKGRKLYMMPFYGGCVDFDMRTGPVEADFSSNQNSPAVETYLKLCGDLEKKGENAAQEIEVFVNDCDCRFFTVPPHDIKDNDKFQEYIRWNIKKLSGGEKYYYSYFTSESGTCVQFMEADKLEKYLNSFAGFKNLVRTIDCQIYNEINYFGTLFKIDVKKSSAVLKFHDDGIYMLSFDSNGLGSSRNIEYEFSDSFERKQAGDDEPHRIALINDLIGRMKSGLNELCAESMPKTVYLINSARVDIPYYLKLQISRQITDNLFYVNQKFEEKYNGAAFEHLDFCFESLALRWRNKK